MAKKKGRKEAEQKAKPRSIMEQALLDVAVPEDLYKKASREIKNMEYVTPFTLSQKLSVSISTSKKIIRRLLNEGLLIPYSPGRRSPVYVRKE